MAPVPAAAGNCLSSSRPQSGPQSRDGLHCRRTPSAAAKTAAEPPAPAQPVAAQAPAAATAQPAPARPARRPAAARFRHRVSHRSHP
jgi:hypothetical protein